jgi:hypothetical protein
MQNITKQTLGLSLSGTKQNLKKIKQKPNLDHHDPSKGKPKVRTKPVIDLAVGQVTREGSRG